MNSTGKLQVLSAEMKFRTPLQVGAGEGDELTDSLLRRNSEGELVIPGSSVAGALRGVALRLAPRMGMAGINERPCQSWSVETSRKVCGCVVCRLFGDVSPVEEKLHDGYRAGPSKVWVYDAETVAGNEPVCYIRDSVGIARNTGTAADAVKFDREIVASGAMFLLRLRIESLEEPERILLGAVLDEWARGRGWIGAGSARGQGAFSLQNICVREWDLSDPEQLMEYLAQEDHWQGGHNKSLWIESSASAFRTVVKPVSRMTPAGAARSFVQFDAQIAFQGGFLINDMTSTFLFDFDHAPMLSAPSPGRLPVLPGSSLRGVVRSQAERILRTLACLQGEENYGARCPACDSLQRRRRQDKSILESCDSMLETFAAQKKKVANHEKPCLACQLFGSSREGSRLRLEDAPYQGPHPVRYKALDFLAVDRFTGGGQAGRKFDALAVWDPTFHARLFLESPQDWEIGLLLLTLRDIEEGLVPVGFGGAKGFGRVEKAVWNIKYGTLAAADRSTCLEADDLNETHTDGIWDVLSWKEVQFSKLSPGNALHRWANNAVEALQHQVNTFQRSEALRYGAKQDSYFGGSFDIQTNILYPLIGGAGHAGK